MSVSASKGSANEALNLIGTDLLPTVGSVYSTTSPGLTSYANYLEGITSPNSTDRMAAAAPLISDITSQTEGALEKIKNLPRGGEQDYLSALTTNQGAAEVSNTLNQAFSQGEMQLGQLGEFGANYYLQGVGESINGVLGAGNLQLNNEMLADQENQNMMQDIIGVASAGAAVYGAAAGGGGD